MIQEKKLFQDINALRTARSAKNDQDKINSFGRGIKELSITSIDIVSLFESYTTLQNDLIDDPVRMAKELQISATAAIRIPLRKYLNEHSSKEQQDSFQKHFDSWVHMDPGALRKEIERIQLLASDAPQVKIDGKRINPNSYWKKLAKKTESLPAAEFGNVGKPKSETPAVHLKLVAKACTTEPVKSLLIMAATETNVPEKERLCALAMNESVVTYGILQMQLLLKEWQDTIELLGTLIAELGKSSREKVVHQFMLDHPKVYERFKKLYNDLELEITKVTKPLSAVGSRDDILWEEWSLMTLILQFMRHVREHADLVSEAIAMLKHPPKS